LADIVGYEELDLVADLISHRRDVVRSLLEPKPGEDSSFSGRLMSRAEREEALRRQDWDHKNASLSQAVDRTGPQYPHVYQTFSAGNKLSAYGKKYALPPNHKHYDDNIYEEYEIPAAPVGTLGVAESSLRSASWTVYASGPSRATSLLTACKAWCILWHTRRARICLSARPLVLVKRMLQC
jgi:hypothetical protein